MSLTRVTITGADDNVDPAVLAHLSRDYPFVEWGILFSTGRRGTPRYPSAGWINRFYEIASRQTIRMAAHFCGEYTRETMAGDDKWLDSLPSFFKRVQLNGFSTPTDGLLKVIAARETSPEIILQVRHESALQDAAYVAYDIRFNGGAATALFDPSGGRGIETFKWPVAPLGLTLGYAGGIKPANVLDVIREIGPVNHDYWIDMESGVRVENAFSLLLVRDVLDRVAPFVK